MTVIICEIDEQEDTEYCQKCGNEKWWVDCHDCGGEGDYDLYDEDPLWYDPGDWEDSFSFIIHRRNGYMNLTDYQNLESRAAKNDAIMVDAVDLLAWRSEANGSCRRWPTGWCGLASRTPANMRRKSRRL